MSTEEHMHGNAENIAVTTMDVASGLVLELASGRLALVAAQGLDSSSTTRTCDDIFAVLESKAVHNRLASGLDDPQCRTVKYTSSGKKEQEGKKRNAGVIGGGDAAQCPESSSGLTAPKTARGEPRWLAS